MNRRQWLTGGALLAAAGAGGGWYAHRAAGDVSLMSPRNGGQGMRYRKFGRTGIDVSEVGFGSWGIGGSYGAIERQDSLNALVRAQELGCNFVDSAAVYGDAEVTLGEFLAGRRDRWIVATKFSGQKAGMTATLEAQLRNLRTEAVDLYQLHWVPKDQTLYDELAQLKKAGKTRFIGVSLYTAEDIDFVLRRPEIDSLQVAFSLLDPDPFLSRVRAIHEAGKAVIVRSALREGFLTGKFKRDQTFADPADQRHELSAEQIATTVDQVERLRFLEKDAGSMVVAAARYPLSFADVATVILGTKSARQADSNFGQVPGGTLSTESLARVRSTQLELGLGSRWRRVWRRWGLAS
ncbi:MAG TPA: aldo/keto reductase [Steroidobacteraceae bacterium]|nr:aldo/keto reductase [Steroidobacteraceae bacterium]